MELFEAGELFDDDYAWFYDQVYPAERSAAEAAEVVALLGLSLGASILVVPCGHGRISNPLAAAGFAVTGVDSSESFLMRASFEAQIDGVDVEYLLGDMRDIPNEQQYDAVLCWFTSFGYFEDDGNRQVLGEFARVLKPGGTVLIETINEATAHLLLESPHEPSVVTRGEDTLSDYSSFDADTGRLVCDRTVIRDGLERHVEFAVRLPSIDEFTDWLAGAGFKNPRFSDRQGKALTEDSFRLVAQATRG